jgi:4-amino-4-deoxy-L-arabinose transferase-like glycosyltransferase
MEIQTETPMTSSSTLSPRITGMIWTFLFASALIRCWLMPLRSGFWLDETATYYIISGNWHQFLERMSATIQSPLYCGMLWLVYHGVGSSELILRAPSILAMALAAFLLHRLASRLVDPAAGLTASLVFIAMPDIGHLAYQARPYSLSMALVLASLLCFWRWLESRRRLNAALCIVLLAAAFYSHPTCGLILFVYVVVIAREVLSGRTMAWKEVSLGAASLAVLSLPILPYYRSVAARASSYSFAKTPAWIDYFYFFPGIVSAALVLGNVFERRLAYTASQQVLRADDHYLVDIAARGIGGGCETDLSQTIRGPLLLVYSTRRRVGGCHVCMLREAQAAASDVSLCGDPLLVR